MSWIRRLRNLMRGEDLDRDIDREMAFHLREKTDELIASGMKPEEASLQARRAFGNRQIQKERVRDIDIFGSVESVAQDLRYALRQLRKSPIFAVTTIVILAVGIGATTAVFNVVNAVMLKPLPVFQPGQLRQLEWSVNGRDFLRSVS